MKKNILKMSAISLSILVVLFVVNALFLKDSLKMVGISWGLSTLYMVLALAMSGHLKIHNKGEKNEK